MKRAWGLMLLALALGWAGCKSRVPEGYDPLALRFFMEARDSEQGLVMTLPLTAASVPVRAKAVFTEADVLNAEVVRVDLGQCLLVQMTPAAARDLYRLTGTNQGYRLVLTANDRPVGVRRIDRAIDDGNLLIFLEVADEELAEMVTRVKETSEVVQKAIKRS